MRQPERTRCQESRTVPLRAGPVSLSLSGCDLRRIVLCGREVIQRMYVAVRDRTWGTAPNRIVEQTVEQKEDGFRVRLNVESVTESVDFVWSASIDGTVEGSIDFSFEGVARRDFYRNRIGFCILLPQEAAGTACRGVTSGAPQSPLVEGRLPLLISPHQPFRDLTSFSYEAEQGVWSRLDFEGDVFEMEDQRNWTDASFKIYCTPLDVPFPVLVKEGDRIRQRVGFSLRDGSGAPLREAIFATAPPRANARKERPISVEIGAPDPRTLCRIGFGAGEADANIPGLASRAATLCPDHLRIEADLDVEDWRERILRGSRLAQEIGTPLWCLLTTSGREAPTDLAESLGSMPQPPAALLVTRNVPPWNTDAALVESVRAQFRHAGQHPLFGGGTDAWFAQLNRSRPEAKDLDFVFYSATPQVHAADNASIIENLPGLASTVDSASLLAGGKAVAVSPLSLAPRFNPAFPNEDIYPLEREARRTAGDPRQRELFGAAWALMSIRHLSDSNAWAVTFDELEGSRGVFSLDPSAGSRLFPVFHLFQELSRWSGAQLLAIRSGSPQIVDGLAVISSGGGAAFLANLGDCARTVKAEGLRGRVVRALHLSERGWQAQAKDDQYRLRPFSILVLWWD